MRDKILSILHTVRPEGNFAASTDYLGDGLLDSFDIVTLVSSLDDAFGISIDGLDILPENFSSITAIEALLIKTGVKA